MTAFDDHIINAYVRGELADDLSDQLESAASVDVGLRERIEHERLVIAGIEAFEAKRIKTHVAMVIDRYRNGRRRLWWLLIAFVLFGILCLYYIMSQSGVETRTKTNQELFATYYETPVLHSTSRSRSTSADTIMMLQAAYSTGDFEKVAQLGSLLDTRNMEGKYRLMLAIAYMEGEEWMAALNTLEEVTASNEYIEETIEWYRCLLFIQLGRIEDAHTLLPVLAQDSGHEYNEQARELLRELR